jgi:hypothetical protein
MRTNGLRATEPAAVEDLGLGVGELVEVRSESEILATLDERGRLEALPFMPEMRQFAGKRFRVSKQAFKACDQVNNSGMFRMERSVHLEGARCDGQAHGGCQAGCLLYWKDAWLKRVEPDGEAPATEAPAAEAPARPPVPSGNGAAAAPSPCTVDTLVRETRAGTAASGEEIYSCQATELPKALTTHIRAWDVRQYVQDVTSGNASLSQTVRGVLILAFNKFQKATTRLLPRPLRIRGGSSYPFLEGKLNGKTPKDVLDLQPGELVEVKSKREILQTINKANKNRGLRFDVEGLPYCGKRARVLRRVDRLIDEKTGTMVHIPGDCVVLDGVICAAAYHQNCPRGIYEFWREAWLRRVEE